MTGNGRKISPPKEIAYIAVMCALLIGGQYALSFAMGVEIVTLLLVCFSYKFGARRGMICAVAFSLIRCLLYGFYPTVILLYLIYYPFLTAVFGLLGHIKKEAFSDYTPVFAVAVNILLAGIALFCAFAYFYDLIHVSRLWKSTVRILLWVIFSLCVLLLSAYDGLLIAGYAFKKNTSEMLRLITLASIAALCTIIFTLLDDIITPLFWGYSKSGALAYFYSSFTAMLPQTVCTIVTVTTLFLPLTAAFDKIIK